MASAGISSVLNIAKEALLTHQASIAVAGHNIANVDTPGYSRQVLNLTTNQPTPDRVGFFGNGVMGVSITRKYDQFMVQRLMNQNSTLNNLQAQQQSMKVIETTFNEVPGLAVNDLMSQFWDSWQALSDNPELSASRQTVVQQAGLIAEQLKGMSAELTQSRYDIEVDLKSSIGEVNALTEQIADLNGKISSSETPAQQQNDLRDTRDRLMNDLSNYLDLTYFEADNGAYTIMMTDGHSLVEGTDHWSLSWSDNKLHWVSTNSLGDTTSAVLQDDVALGGKVGGLRDIFSTIKEGDPDNYTGRLNAVANALIREVNQLHAQGVGTTLFSKQLTSAEMANDTTLLHTTVDVNTCTDTIEAGTLTINDRAIGKIDGTIATYGLAMGKAYNAAAAINEAEAGVTARLTTLVAGNAIAGGLSSGEQVTFTVNGVSVDYTASANETAAETAANVAAAINSAITSYNNQTTPKVNTPKVTIEAVVGNGLNGGAANSIILRNTNQGDESHIVIDGVDTTDAAEVKLGLTDGTYEADASHNTGELSTFSWEGPVQIEGGADDTVMAQLGWGGTLVYSDSAMSDEPADGVASTLNFDLNGVNIDITIPDGTTAANAVQMAVDQINDYSTLTTVTAEVGDGLNGGVQNSIVFKTELSDIKIKNYSVTAGDDIFGFSDVTKLGVASADDQAGDGKLTYTFSDHGVANSMMGMAYSKEVTTDDAAFEMWLYNSDGSLALAQPVSISLERAYDLQDVADAINTSIVNAIDDPAVTAPWVAASVVNNQLVLTPDADHQFAFGNDSSNFLAAIGLNTFFTGYDATTIDVNSLVSDNLDKVAAGRINDYGEFFTGDNANALRITNIQRDETVTFTGSSSTDTIDGYYNALVADIGIRGKSINSDIDYNQLVGDQLKEMRDATSGVSLDEEMANLIKFQHAYTAAARLISISDEMMQSLLDTI